MSNTKFKQDLTTTEWQLKSDRIVPVENKKSTEIYLISFYDDGNGLLTVADIAPTAAGHREYDITRDIHFTWKFYSLQNDITLKRNKKDITPVTGILECRYHVGRPGAEKYITRQSTFKQYTDYVLNTSDKISMHILLETDLFDCITEGQQNLLQGIF